MNDFSVNKKVLRKEILSVRKQMNLDEKLQKDKAIEDKFFRSEEYKNSRNIFIYISYDSEINTKDIILKAIDEGKRIYVPRTNVDLRIMEAVEINSLENLIVDKYGILEPDESEECINPDELDLIVVPGVAFDKNGGRMGYGAGYYDKYFKTISREKKNAIRKVALAYDFQVINEVPMNEDDEYINKIITESKIL